jgi:hypothetical protein
MSAEFSREGCGRPSPTSTGYRTPKAHLCGECFEIRDRKPPPGWEDLGNGLCYFTIPECAIPYARAWEVEDEMESHGAR